MPPDLRERLRAALAQPARETRSPGEAAVTELADLSRLGGRWFSSDAGPGYVIESVYDAGHSHGRVPLHQALTIDTPRLAPQCRDSRIAAVRGHDLLYVDTETTGLGGAGAMVFLAGVARFVGSQLHLRQYLLPSPLYEGGLLGGLSSELGAARALVSYNGKSFDLPLLESRYILSRQRADWRSVPHLDLLHPNRRLFRGAVESHRLVAIESELLGFEREDDCPSAEVPERYFRFQRSGDPTWILPVLRHNAWDILSLVALAAHLAAVCEGTDHPFEAARAAAYAGDHAGALTHFGRFLDRGQAAGRAATAEALEGAARAAMRLGDYELAASYWEQLIRLPRARRLTPYVELAKIQEHRLRDGAAALGTVATAVSLLGRGLLPPGPPTSEQSLAALTRRLARLQARSLRA